MSVSLTFNCDGCGKSAPGVSPSVYSPPPVGWLWATQQGPHACGERCWWHVDTAHKGRTGQSLEAISHDSVEVEGEEQPAPEPAAPSALAVLPKQANGHSNGHQSKPAPVAKPAPARRTVIEAEVVEEDDGPTARVVPLGQQRQCSQCGAALPPYQGRGKPRTMCVDCNPPLSPEERKKRNAAEAKRRKARAAQA